MLENCAGKLLITAICLGVEASSASAGWFCFKNCAKSEACVNSCETYQEECCHPKKRRHCGCQDAPRGEIAFAIPGVVRSGQAIQVSDEVARRGVERAVARDLRKKDTEAGARDLEEDRLDKLEKDVEKLADATKRLTLLVDRIDQKINKQD